MMNILIVDDEPKIRKGLRHIIDWWKYDISIAGSASNGLEALEIIENPESAIDLVITDVEMPDMDGIELSGIVKKKYPGIKVIILSGYDDFDYARNAMKYGVNDYLLKPVDEEELLAIALKIKKELAEREYHYPERFEEILIENIDNCLTGKIRENTGKIFRHFSSERYNLEQIKGILNLIFLNIEDKILPSGVGFRDISGREDYKTANKNCKTVDEARDLFLKSLMIFAEHKAASKSLTIINQIKNYIERNLQGDVSLNAVAAQFLLNPSYLSQLFKKHYEGGFSSYITDLKVKKAKTLLLDENLKISEVSGIVGYNDVKYFSRLFKSKVGMLPSEYRKQLKEG